MTKPRSLGVPNKATLYRKGDRQHMPTSVETSRSNHQTKYTRTIRQNTHKRSPLICHFRNEKRTEADMMRPAVVSWIVTGVALISDWPIFSLSLVTVSKVFAKVNSSQFPIGF